MADLQVFQVDIDSLQPYHRNPRRGNVAKIAESLKVRGQYRPIVVNKGNQTGIENEILAGNHTWQAAKSLGWSHIQIVTVDVDSDQAAQIVVADNKLSDIGEYDMKALAEVLEGLEAPTLGTGFDEDEVAEIIATAQPAPTELSDPNDVPDTPSEPFTKGGASLGARFSHSPRRFKYRQRPRGESGCSNWHSGMHVDRSTLWCRIRRQD